MIRRNDITPDYCNRETVARRLDMAPGYVDQLVRRGILPAPIAIGEALRWRWADIDAALAAPATGHQAPGGYDAAADPYVVGATRAARASPAPARQARHEARPTISLPHAPPRDGQGAESDPAA